MFFSNIVFKGIFEHKGIIDYIRSCVDYKKYFENNKYFPCLRQTKGAEIYYTSSMYINNDYEHDKNKIKKKKNYPYYHNANISCKIMSLLQLQPG